MMKNKTLLTGKLAAVVLAAAMIFGVTACKGTAADTAEGTAAAESVTEAVPAALSTAAEETGTAVESREEAAEEATAEFAQILWPQQLISCMSNRLFFPVFQSTTVNSFPG